MHIGVVYICSLVMKAKDMRNLCAILIMFLGITLNAQSHVDYNLQEQKQAILKAVNKIRVKGCKCGRKRMAPVKPLKWNNKLYKSAYLHSKEMAENGFFSHYSKNGNDVGDKLEAVSYNWKNAGENIAEGQKKLSEVMVDWLESKTHCKMIMHPEMTEMGMARVGKYWVHHLGSPMPPKTRRVKTSYRQG